MYHMVVGDLEAGVEVHRSPRALHPRGGTISREDELEHAAVSVEEEVVDDGHAGVINVEAKEEHNEPDAVLIVLVSISVG